MTVPRSAFLVPLARSRPAYVEASLAQDRSAKKLVRDDARKPMQLCLMAMHSCLAHDRASKLLNGGVSVENERSQSADRHAAPASRVWRHARGLDGLWGRRRSRSESPHLP